MKTGTIPNDIIIQNKQDTSSSTGTIPLDMNKPCSQYVLLSAYSNLDDQITIKIRVNNGYYYGCAYGWDGAIKTNYSYSIRLVWKKIA